VPFTPRLENGSIRVKGDIVFIGNSIVTGAGLPQPYNGNGINNNNIYTNNNACNNINSINRKFMEPSTWVPDQSKLNPDILNCANSIDLTVRDYLSTCDRLFNKNNNLTYNRENNANNIDYNNCFIRNNCKSNISATEFQSIRSLQNDNSIIIKPFDKGGGITIMDRAHYINEACRQLNNTKYYKKIDKLLTTETAKEVANILEDMYMEGNINKKQLKYLTGPARFRPRIFYLLPKVHKPKQKWPHPNMPEGRPIVSDIDSESHRVSELIEHYLNPLSVKHASYIKNSYEFVNKIRNNVISKNSLIVTADVSSLYTNMHIDRSVSCVRTAFRECPEAGRPDRHILRLLELTMRTNDFEFNGEYFLQILGTAMGKRYAPSLANIYLLEFDQKAIDGFKIKPKFYFRYLDDIFFIWEAGEGELKEYEAYLNSLIPDINISFEYSTNQTNFLDTTVYKNYNNNACTLQTRVYFKDTDTHQLLHRDSYHPKHTFRGLIRSQYIRFKRLSSTQQDYMNTCKILNMYLKNRGYTYTQLRKEMFDIWHNYVDQARGGTVEGEGEREGNGGELFPIITEYGEEGKFFAHKFREILKNSDTFKDKNFITAYKNSRNLKQLLVRSKLSPAYDGNFRACGNARCQACKHAQEGELFRSTTHNKEFKYIQKTNCGTQNVIYLITCQKCNKQYVGETGRQLRQRLTDHRHCIRSHISTPVGKHFNLPDHELRDLKITVLESLDAVRGDWKIRREKELKWQQKLGTIHPQGLNEEQPTTI